jgi:hypothetical protein
LGQGRLLFVMITAFWFLYLLLVILGHVIYIYIYIQVCADFHSPLTTLRDNLIVALLDADGKEISHAGS